MSIRAFGGNRPGGFGSPGACFSFPTAEQDRALALGAEGCPHAAASRQDPPPDQGSRSLPRRGPRGVSGDALAPGPGAGVQGRLPGGGGGGVRWPGQAPPPRPARPPFPCAPGSGPRPGGGGGGGCSGRRRRRERPWRRAPGPARAPRAGAARVQVRAPLPHFATAAPSSSPSLLPPDPQVLSPSAAPHLSVLSLPPPSCPQPGLRLHLSGLALPHTGRIIPGSPSPEPTPSGLSSLTVLFALGAPDPAPARTLKASERGAEWGGRSPVRAGMDGSGPSPDPLPARVPSPLPLPPHPLSLFSLLAPALFHPCLSPLG